MVSLSNIVILLGLGLQSTWAWQCLSDSECSSLSGSVCVNGVCGCPAGLLAVLGGTLCGQWSPYYTSSCFEDHQCARLFTSYQCRLDATNEGNCHCLPGNHYLSGRCWKNTEHGESCTRDEECQGSLRDPFNMVCNGTCECADGYYLRQRGECRRIGFGVGDGCVLNEDCRFENGACDQNSLSCYNINEGKQNIIQQNIKMASTYVTEMAGARQHGVLCGAGNVCVQPFECSTFGACVCPTGYYVNNDETLCLAELGSPSTTEQCVGLFAVVRDSVCTCPNNFYFDENMRDCVKATLRLTDSCVSDHNCHTFGSGARCGEPQQWEIRSCECTPEVTVWDEERQLCRFIVGLGEPCTADSECMIGDQQVVCATDATGQGVCACPDGYNTVGNQCLTSGLVLNDTCRDTQECTGTTNTICDGTCRCAAEYIEIDGACAPGIGGMCQQDAECIVDNTFCDGTSSCQCEEQTIEYEGQCYPHVSGYNASCIATIQCQQSIGNGSSCQNNQCLCDERYHYRDSGCWPITGLFEICHRTSECYLSGLSERVVCRNSLCQCDFNFPYSEPLHTCTSSASTTAGNMLLTTSILLYIYLRY